MTTTNYYDTFIAVADDCPVTRAEIPPAAEPRSAARVAYDMLSGSPYVHTSDDVLYAANGARLGISHEDFFSRGQPCLRSSPLTKRYGWGVHSDANGHIALYPMGSREYATLVRDRALRQLKARRSQPI
jgi:hypothetical protein